MGRKRRPERPILCIRSATWSKTWGLLTPTSRSACTVCGSVGMWRRTHTCSKCGGLHDACRIITQRATGACLKCDEEGSNGP